VRWLGWAAFGALVAVVVGLTLILVWALKVYL
jgi:hypothetical protein